MKLGGAGQVLLRKIMDSGYDVWIPDYGSAFPLFSSKRFFRVLLQLLVLVNWYLTTSQEEHRVRVCDKGDTKAWTRRSVGVSTMPPVEFVPLPGVHFIAGTRDTHGMHVRDKQSHVKHIARWFAHLRIWRIRTIDVTATGYFNKNMYPLFDAESYSRAKAVGRKR